MAFSSYRLPEVLWISCHHDGPLGVFKERNSVLVLSGIYECQVSTTPVRSHLIHLSVAGMKKPTIKSKKSVPPSFCFFISYYVCNLKTRGTIHFTIDWTLCFIPYNIYRARDDDPRWPRAAHQIRFIGQPDLWDPWLSRKAQFCHLVPGQQVFVEESSIQHKVSTYPLGLFILWCTY